MTDKGGKFRRMIIQVFTHFIEEREQISVLFLDKRQLEDIEQFLQQFIEWHQAQGIHMLYKQLVRKSCS